MDVLADVKTLTYVPFSLLHVVFYDFFFVMLNIPLLTYYFLSLALFSPQLPRHPYSNTFLAFSYEKKYAVDGTPLHLNLLHPLVEHLDYALLMLFGSSLFICSSYNQMCD